MGKTVPVSPSAIGRAEIDEVIATLKSGWLSAGPKVAAFETAFARYFGYDDAVAVSSFTAGLHLALIGCDLLPGDEVIVSPLSPPRVINTLLHTGAVPVLVDIDPSTYNLDPDAVEEAVTPRTRAILAGHFAGRSIDLMALLDTVQKHDLFLIEDCTHAIETERERLKAGTIGDFAVFRLSPAGPVACAEGGVILAREPADLDRIKLLSDSRAQTAREQAVRDRGARDQGARDESGGLSAAPNGARAKTAMEPDDCAFDYAMGDLQAAIALHQFWRLEKSWSRRWDIWEHYSEVLAGQGLILPPPVRPDERHARVLYTVEVDPERTGIDRDGFRTALRERKIATLVHYPCITDVGLYSERLGTLPDQTPAARDAGRRLVSLPLSAALSDDQVESVLSAVTRTLRTAARRQIGTRSAVNGAQVA